MRVAGVIVDVQHGVKSPTAAHDPGASVRLGDGSRVYERDLTPWLAQGVEDVCRQEGVPFHRVAVDGRSYGQRAADGARWVAELKADGPVAYLALHLNAGSDTARYGAVGFDRRSRWGRAHVNGWALSVDAQEVGVSGIRAWELYRDPARHWITNGHYTIRHVYDHDGMFGVLCEWNFLAQVQPLGVAGVRRLGGQWARPLLTVDF